MRGWAVVVGVWLGCLAGCSVQSAAGGGEAPPPLPDLPSPPPPACERTRCTAAACGVVPDGCGDTLDCGGCGSGFACGAAGTPNVCAPVEPPVEPVQAEPLDTLTGNIVGVKACREDGWCTRTGYMGAQLLDVWGSSAEDVWAVGGSASGVVLRWDGARWREVAVPAVGRLAGVWSAAADDVWAVGRAGTVLRWDGERWRRVPVPASVETADLTGVSGTSADDVWLVGPDVALHWDGTRLQESPGWTPLAPLGLAEYARGLTRVWALGTKDALAAGGPVCQRWDGQTWTPTACGVQGATDVWASGPDDIWVVGWEPASYADRVHRAHWNGQTWTNEEWRTFLYQPVQSVWGFGRDAVWMSGQQFFDGQRWTAPGASEGQLALWGDRPDRLFGSGSYGGLWRRDASGWHKDASTRVAKLAYARSPQGSTWLLTSTGRIFRRDADTWSLGTKLPWDSERVDWYTPVGFSADDAYVMSGFGNASHWASTQEQSLGDGRVWTDMPGRAFRVTGAEDHRRVFLWGAPQPPVNTILEVGDGEVSWLWGAGPDDVWAVGWRRPAGNTECSSWCPEATGVAWHWDGQRWTERFQQRGLLLYQVYGASSTDVWFVGWHAGENYAMRWTTLRWTGGDLTEVQQFPESRWLGSMTGTGPDDLWMLGANPADGFTNQLFHFDGTSWKAHAPMPSRIRDLGALPGDRAFLNTVEGVTYERRR